MTRILVDRVLRDKLRDLKEPLELCDESGRVLAQVVPATGVSEYEPCEPPVPNEELLRRARSTGRRYTTAEVLAYLESL
ncbi:MAG TPA: hypothetical protein VG406_05280 [Isosphaeraceae bacterium]|jgi:hypothetical protein|nr:hypothetical protein [Isosphaeraceae bacterium]